MKKNIQIIFTSFFFVLFNINNTIASDTSGLSPGNNSVTVTDNNGRLISRSATIMGAVGLTLNIDTIHDMPPCVTISNGILKFHTSGGSGHYKSTVVAGGLGGVQDCCTQPFICGCFSDGCQTGALWSGCHCVQFGDGSGDFNCLSANTYTIIILDSITGFSLIDSVEITQPAPLTVTASNNGPVCFGNSAILSANVSGAIGVVSFEWTPSIGLNPNAFVQNPEVIPNPGTTEYTVSVTAGACSSTATTSVSSGEVLIATTATVNFSPACAGPGLVATANSTGGGVPFSYAWSDGIGGSYPNEQSISLDLSPGAYTLECIVSDACGSSAVTSSVNVVINPTPIASISPAGAISSCSDAGSIILNANTDFGSLYQWKKNGVNIGANSSTLSVNSSGSYTVVISDGTCSGESAATLVTITPNASSPINVTPSNINGCKNASTSASFTGNCNVTDPVLWYDQAVGGTLLATATSFNPITQGGASTAISGVKDFYAECSNGGCASARTHVTFTIGQDPDDGNPCTVDACDPATGVITHAPASCDYVTTLVYDSCEFKNIGNSLLKLVDDGDSTFIKTKHIGLNSNEPFGISINTPLSNGYMWDMPGKLREGNIGNDSDTLFGIIALHDTIRLKSNIISFQNDSVEVYLNDSLIGKKLLNSSTLRINNWGDSYRCNFQSEVINAQYSRTHFSILFANEFSITAPDNSILNGNQLSFIFQDSVHYFMNRCSLISENNNEFNLVDFEWRPRRTALDTDTISLDTTSADNMLTNNSEDPTVHVSHELMNVLTDWTNQPESGALNLVDYLLAQNVVSQSEVSSFLTAFFTNAPNFSQSGSNKREGNCFCKPIESVVNSGILLIPSSQTQTYSSATINKTIGDWSYGYSSIKNGAAHYEFLNVNGNNQVATHEESTSDDNSASPTQVVSEIMYICVDVPSKQKSPCCTQKVELKAVYNSDLWVNNTAKNWNHGSYGESEDAVALFTYDVNGPHPALDVLNAKRDALANHFNSSFNPDFWISAVNLTASVTSSVVTGTLTPAQITAIANGITGLIGNSPVTITGTEGASHKIFSMNYLGELTLLPNVKKVIQMVSRGHLYGHGYGGKSQAQARIASDFAFSIIVKQNADVNCCLKKSARWVTAVIKTRFKFFNTIYIINQSPDDLQTLEDQVGLQLYVYKPWIDVKPLISSPMLEDNFIGKMIINSERGYAIGTISCSPIHSGGRLNANIFFQGFYLSAGLMTSTLFNEGVGGAGSTDVDTVSIGLMDASNYQLVDLQKGILQTNGNINVSFSPNAIVGNPYYIRVTHRNTIQTWSKVPVILNTNTNYSFSSSATQAYGDNEIEAPDNAAWLIYSGDINQDGAIDATDFLNLDPLIQNGAGGYLAGDFNGDGSVDASDFLLLDPNIQNGVGAVTP